MKRDKTYVRIKSPEEIRSYHRSTTSMTWGSGGEIDKDSIFLCSPSKQRANDIRVVYYCTKNDWNKAFFDQQK